MAVSRSRRRLGLLAVAVGLAVLPLQAAAASTEDGPTVVDDSATAQEPADPVAALTLTVRPIVAAATEDSDLVLDQSTGLATLTFSPDRPTRQRAVLEFVVENTGESVLEGVAITADRVGTVLDAAAGTTLAPGEQTTVRGAVEVTWDQARSGLAGLVDVAASATATAPGGATVRDDARGLLQVVAVLPAPTATLTLAVLTDAGDAASGPGGIPSLTWSEDEAAEGVVRRVHHRLTVVNTGPVAIEDLAGTVELLEVAVDAELPTSLEPGGEVVVDVVHEVRPDDVAGVGTEGPIETELVATATVTGTDGGTESLTLEGTTVVLGVVVRPLPEEVVLPVAGPPTRGDLSLLAFLSLGLGIALLMAAPRPRPA